MKRILIALLLITFNSIAQQEDNLINYHEIRLNVFNLAVLEAIDIQYEYLHKNHSLGLDVYYKLTEVEGAENRFIGYTESFNRKQGLTSYYRFFLRGKRLSSFFMEGYIMLASGEIEKEIYHYNLDEYAYKRIKYTNLNIGFSIGYKFVSKKRFTATIYAGFSTIVNGYKGARNANRGGVSVGYRFK